MLSLAIVSLSLCSAAISSRTGATILHGPHHSAQKSTSSGLSLPSTSLAELSSVTVLVLPAMGRSPSWSTRPVDLGQPEFGLCAGMPLCRVLPRSGDGWGADGPFGSA